MDSLTIKINKHTPLTVNEIDKQQLKKQISLKQNIQGKHNLPKFLKKVIFRWCRW